MALNANNFFSFSWNFNHKMFISAADIVPHIRTIDVAGNDGIVRGHTAQLTLSIAVSNFDGALFNPASSGNNFDLDFFVANTNTSTNGSDFAIQDERISITVTQTPDLSFGLGIFEMKNVTFQLDISISPDTCLEVNFLCVNFSSPSSASFIPVNHSNDIDCYNIKSVLECQPG